MRHTFRSGEIAHVWVNDVDKSVGYGKCGNTSFSGDQFISYRTPIAVRITTPSGKPFYILDAERYSSSTSKHQCGLRAALRGSPHANVLVYCGWHVNLPRTPEGLLNKLIDEAKEHVVKAGGKGDRFKWPLYSSAQGRLDTARMVANLFHLKLGSRLRIMPSPKVLAKYKALSDKWRVNVQARHERKWERDRKQREIREAAQIAEAIQRAEKLIAGCRFPELKSREDYFGHGDYLLESRPDLLAPIEAWRKEKYAKDIEAWKAGADVEPRYEWPTMLRLEVDPDLESAKAEVVTSRGARVPAEDAKRAFNFAMKFIKSGREWRRNGEQFHVGHYQLDSITDKGIQAGCHLITWDVVIEFGKKMGWTTCQEKNASLTERSES